MEVLGGEVDLEVDGFEVILEPEFTWVRVKVSVNSQLGAFFLFIFSGNSL